MSNVKCTVKGLDDVAPFRHRVVIAKVPAEQFTKMIIDGLGLNCPANTEIKTVLNPDEKESQFQILLQSEHFAEVKPGWENIPVIESSERGLK